MGRSNVRIRSTPTGGISNAGTERMMCAVISSGLTTNSVEMLGILSPYHSPRKKPVLDVRPVSEDHKQFNARQ